MRFVFLLSCVIFSGSSLLSQCDNAFEPYVSSDCGDNPNVNFIVSGNATFCEKQETEFINETAGEIGYYDFFIIDWGDSTLCDTFHNYDPITHKFNFDGIDRCEEGPKINASMRFIGIKQCDEGISSAGNPKGYEVKVSAVARFDYHQVVCINEPIIIENTSCHADENKYVWEYDNNQSSTNITPTISYPTPGIYSISLTAENDCGSPDQTIKTVTVVDYPEATINTQTNGGTGCNPSRQIISMETSQWNPTEPSGNFNWSISPSYSDVDGKWCFTNDAQQQTPCPQDPNNSFCPCIPDSLLSQQIIDSLLRLPILDIWFKESGEYPIQLDYGNACDDLTTFDTIHIYEQPDIIGFENISECDSLTLCYDDLDIGFVGDIANYEWTFDGGIPTNFSDPDPDFGCIKFTSDGSVSLTVRAFEPCNDVTQEVAVTIIITEQVNVDNPIPFEICQNEGGIFLDPNPPGGCYFFNGNETDFIVGDTLYPESLPADDYEIIYLVGKNTECEASDTFNFTIIEAPFIQIGNIGLECESISNFNPPYTSEGDIDQYSWQLCDSTGSTVAVSNRIQPFL